MERHVHLNIFMGSDLQTVCHEAHEGKEPCILFLLLIIIMGLIQPSQVIPKDHHLAFLWGRTRHQPPGNSELRSMPQGTKATRSHHWQWTHPGYGWGNKARGATGCTTWKARSVPSFCRAASICWAPSSEAGVSYRVKHQSTRTGPRSTAASSDNGVKVHITYNFSFSFTTGEVLLC